MQQAELKHRERRDKHRLPFDRRVQLRSQTAGSLQLDGIDYSPTGIAVYSSQQLPVGEQVVLRFPVGRNQLTELEVCGEVIHNIPRGDGFVVGVRFVTQADTALRTFG